MSKLVVIVLILGGYVVGQAAKAPQSPRPARVQSASADAASAGGQSGRFQVFFSPHARADVYLMDTQTGRIWKPITINNAKDTNLEGTAPQVWLYQDRIDSEQEFATWIALHKAPSPAPPQQ